MQPPPPGYHFQELILQKKCYNTPQIPRYLVSKHKIVSAGAASIPSVEAFRILIRYFTRNPGYLAGGHGNVST